MGSNFQNPPSWIFPDATNEKPQILMAKTQGFYKVVRASAVTHRKRQISKVVTPPIPDYRTIRAYNRTFWDPTTQWIALTSEHQELVRVAYMLCLKACLQTWNVISLRLTFLIPLTIVITPLRPIYSPYCQQRYRPIFKFIHRSFLTIANKLAHDS